MKTLVFSFIASLLICSILAPSVEALVFAKNDLSLVVDLNEEENSSENELKIGEKDGVLPIESLLALYASEQTASVSMTALISLSEGNHEVVLPPPEPFA
ncbi:MAG: hypothetical protein HRT65_10630 [Flavobacteriaceae bacterium]|nr:hypothetical protein [Flavobacteriaceae bacterium]